MAFYIYIDSAKRSLWLYGFERNLYPRYAILGDVLNT